MFSGPVRSKFGDDLEFLRAILQFEAEMKEGSTQQKQDKKGELRRKIDTVYEEKLPEKTTEKPTVQSPRSRL